jgi:hypothetical protein
MYKYVQRDVYLCILKYDGQNHEPKKKVQVIIVV